MGGMEQLRMSRHCTVQQTCVALSTPLSIARCSTHALLPAPTAPCVSYAAQALEFWCTIAEEEIDRDGVRLLRCAALCCAVLCCAVLCCAVHEAAKSRVQGCRAALSFAARHLARVPAAGRPMCYVLTWRTPCLPIPVQDASSGSSDPDSVNHNFIKAALPHLVPLLLEQLTKQEEGQETDDGVWNVSMVRALLCCCGFRCSIWHRLWQAEGVWPVAAPGPVSGQGPAMPIAAAAPLLLNRCSTPPSPLPQAAGTCLALCASVAGDAIVPLVMPFVTANIQKADGAESWRFREAATFAFGSILEGPVRLRGASVGCAVTSMACMQCGCAHTLQLPDAAWSSNTCSPAAHGLA